MLDMDAAERLRRWRVLRCRPSSRTPPWHSLRNLLDTLHCVRSHARQCGYVRALDLALERLFAEWDAARTPPQCVVPADLAVEFVRDLRRYPDIVAEPINSTWVRGVYPRFARSRGAVPVSAYKHFAKALGQLMPRRRMEGWRRGKRKTWTSYCMPAEVPINVIALKRP